MKKIFVFLILSLAAVSCYDSYEKDFDFASVYFANQVLVRSVVVGEGMKIEVGVVLGGVVKNKGDREVTFSIDNSLVTPAVLSAMKSGPTFMKNAVSSITTLLPIPSNYFSLSDNKKIVIKSGWNEGSIIFKADSTNFLADPATINATYAFPILITKAGTDSILPAKSKCVIGIKYENMLFGNYWHGGSALVNRPAKADTTMSYYTQIPQPEAKVWALKTAGPNTLYANGYFDQVTTKNEMLLGLSGSDISISTVTGSTWPIAAEGASTFNRAKLLQNRKIVLKYTYKNTVNGYTYHCTDTLTFRNRVRDGINEYQDTDPSHYTN